jgi:hypothetical protein
LFCTAPFLCLSARHTFHTPRLWSLASHTDVFATCMYPVYLVTEIELKLVRRF